MSAVTLQAFLILVASFGVGFGFTLFLVGRDQLKNQLEMARSKVRVWREIASAEEDRRIRSEALVKNHSHSLDHMTLRLCKAERERQKYQDEIGRLSRELTLAKARLGEASSEDVRKIFEFPSLYPRAKEIAKP